MRQKLGVEGARAAWADVANRVKLTEKDISKDALTRIRAMFPPRQPEPEVAARAIDRQSYERDFEPERER